MGFWDIAKKVGEFAIDVGVGIGKEVIKNGKEINNEVQTNKSLSSQDLQKKANDTGFFGASERDRRLAKAELKKREENQ